PRTISTLQKLARSHGTPESSALLPATEKSGQRRTGRQARNSFTMAKCEVCENEYDKAFEVIVAGLGRRLRPRFGHAGTVDRALGWAELECGAGAVPAAKRLQCFICGSGCLGE